MRAHSKRIEARDRASRQGTPGQAAACAKKAEFRREFGAGNPKVQRLYGLCRSIGR
ncbi:hypothetical protein [Novosphingobium sp. B1]|uniref:hypothetical protein n=1 Tax=Novosphingobium sp. B1 TaxID=1938756 RepID=UPI001C3885E7|nr:hypothetical protein [Novosphingobium sp. B1]